MQWCKPGGIPCFSFQFPIKWIACEVVCAQHILQQLWKILEGCHHPRNPSTSGEWSLVIKRSCCSPIWCIKLGTLMEIAQATWIHCGFHLYWRESHAYAAFCQKFFFFQASKKDLLKFWECQRRLGVQLVASLCFLASCCGAHCSFLKSNKTFCAVVGHLLLSQGYLLSPKSNRCKGNIVRLKWVCDDKSCMEFSTSREANK